MSQKELARYIADLLSPLGPITTRAMFGGIGLYNTGLIFGFVIRDALYFKVDSKTQGDYESQDTQPFTYEFKNKTGQMSYWLVPPDIIEDQDQLIQWADAAYHASIRSKTKPKKR